MISFKKNKPIVLKENDDNDIIEIIRPSSNDKKDFRKEVLLFFQKLTNKITNKENIYFGFANINNIKWFSNELLNGSKLINNNVVKLKNFITQNSSIELIIFIYTRRLFIKYSNTFKFVSEDTKFKTNYELINKYLLSEIDKYKKENNLYKYTRKLYKFYLNNNRIEEAKKLNYIFTKDLRRVYKFIENIQNCIIILKAGYQDIDTIIKIKTSIVYSYREIKNLLLITGDNKEEYFKMMNNLNGEAYIMIDELHKIYDFFINELNKLFLNY
jgi:hypothetical protein